jgi:hypothetical protein
MTQLEIVTADIEASQQTINAIQDGNNRSKKAIDRSHRITAEIEEAIREHSAAAHANVAIRRQQTADAHHTMAKRLIAAAEFIQTGRLQIG